MYKVPIIVKKSSIDGMGVFAKCDIKKGEVVWQYKEGLKRTAYLSPTTGMWVIPPDNDPGNYTNHDPNKYNLSIYLDKRMSDEPLFITNRDIKAGEEITNNYNHFDEDIKEYKPDWL